MDSKLTQIERDVLKYLKNHAPEGTLVKNISAMSRELNYSRPTIYKALESLQEKGFISLEQPNHITHDEHHINKKIIQDIVEIQQKLRECKNTLQNTNELLNRCIEFIEEHFSEEG